MTIDQIAQACKAHPVGNYTFNLEHQVTSMDLILLGLKLANLRGENDFLVNKARPNHVIISIHESRKGYKVFGLPKVDLKSFDRDLGRRH